VRGIPFELSQKDCGYLKQSIPWCFRHLSLCEEVRDSSECGSGWPGFCVLMAEAQFFLQESRQWRSEKVLMTELTRRQHF